MKLKFDKSSSFWDRGFDHRDTPHHPPHVWKSRLAYHDKALLVDGLCTAKYPEAIHALFQTALRCCPLVTMDDDIMDGQPCITGTRVPVKSVLRALEHYGSVEQVVKTCYPHLTREQVEDALYFCQVILEPTGGIDEPSAVA